MYRAGLSTLTHNYIGGGTLLSPYTDHPPIILAFPTFLLSFLSCKGNYESIDVVRHSLGLIVLWSRCRTSFWTGMETFCSSFCYKTEFASFIPFRWNAYSSLSVLAFSWIEWNRHVYFKTIKRCLKALPVPRCGIYCMSVKKDFLCLYTPLGYRYSQWNQCLSHLVHLFLPSYGVLFASPVSSCKLHQVYSLSAAWGRLFSLSAQPALSKNIPTGHCWAFSANQPAPTF